MFKFSDCPTLASNDSATLVPPSILYKEIFDPLKKKILSDSLDSFVVMLQPFSSDRLHSTSRLNSYSWINCITV